MNRRRNFRRRPAVYKGQKIEMNFVPILVIICLSVCAGYLTAKYVVYPILGYEPAGLSILKQSETTEESKVQPQSSVGETAASTQAAPVQAVTTAPTTAPSATETTAMPATVIEDQADVKQVAGYALQFGSYSSKAAAEKSTKQLKASGINAKVLKKDGAYKVIGQLFATKDEAKAELSKMDKAVGAFVATIEK